MTDIVERLRAGPCSGDPVFEEAADEIELLRAQNAEMLKVLNLCRIMLKNRDQRPEEMQLLDAIKIVVARAEGWA